MICYQWSSSHASLFHSHNVFCRAHEPSAFDYTEESIDETSLITRKIPKTGMTNFFCVWFVYCLVYTIVKGISDLD